MESVLKEIIDTIQDGKTELDDAWLSRLLRRHNRKRPAGEPQLAKRHLRPFYLKLKAEKPEMLATWGVDEICERNLLRLLQIKPRRTASGLATVTLVTKPHPCSSNCLYCPSDLRMPKSYLPNEPACRRAEQNFFDPYLQTYSRLRALEAMGHITDKVELIILGGSWNDYPLDYQLWFVTEVFRALNEFGHEDGHGLGREFGHGHGREHGRELSQPTNDSVNERRKAYEDAGLTSDAKQAAEQCRPLQIRVNEGELNYNNALALLQAQASHEHLSLVQRASREELADQQRRNEHAACRSVGLCIETRPDLITSESARMMRELGCTKIQMGIQSLDQRVLDCNKRQVSVEQIAESFAVLRRYGFKIMVHMMLNLLGSTLELDRTGYRTLVSDPRFCPDEVKLYPCVLVESSQLMREFERGTWQPYTEPDLVCLLADCVNMTPAYTRISRMIRDIASTDIVAGNKKPNLRQTVESARKTEPNERQEIRQREIATDDIGLDELHVEIVEYTTSISNEKFCQWVNTEGKIAGFLRLSLPFEGSTAMIRELHVYGRVAGLDGSELGGTQHLGLGRSLIELACEHAQAAGFTSLRVISAVGTREYYRELGFCDEELYQVRRLT